MEEIKAIADQLEAESRTFTTLAETGRLTNEVRLHPAAVEGLAQRFAKMAESLKKIAEEIIRPKPE